MRLILGSIATSLSRISAVLAIASCAGLAGGCGHDGGDDGGGTPQDCHVDCFGGAECQGDQLKLWGFAPRPIACDQSFPPDYCVYQRVTCPLGCLADVYVLPGDDVNDPAQYDWLCRSATPATVGAPCANDDQCRPTFAIPASDGSVTQTYLQCSAAGACEIANAPVIPGYGATCTAGPSPAIRVQWIEGAAPGDACLYVRNFDGCVRTFATVTCLGDWECPTGSRCDDVLPHAGGAAATGVCHPGATFGAQDLPCTASARPAGEPERR